MTKRKKKTGTARAYDLEGLVSSHVVEEVQRRCKNGEEFWKVLREAIQSAMKDVRSEGVMVSRMNGMLEDVVPRVLCLLTVDGGNIVVKAGMELMRHEERRKPGRVIPMRRKPGFPPKG